MTANLCQGVKVELNRDLNTTIICYTIYMEQKRGERKKRPLLLLVLGIISLSLLIYGVYTYSPNTILPAYTLLPSLTPLALFFFLLFLSFYSLFGYIFNNNRRGLLISLFFCSYLLLRLNHLTQPFFLILLFSLFLSLELFFSRS